MKEIKIVNLTSRSQKPYSKEDGDNFMATDSGQEIRGDGSIQPKTDGSRQKQLAQTSSNGYDQEIPEAAKETQGTKLTERSLSELDTERLKEIYKCSIIAEQKTSAETADFAEKEKIAAENQDYNQALIRELEGRGVNVADIFLKAAKASAEAGNPVRSIGAATATANTIINRSGITNPFLLRALDKVDNLAGVGMETENLLVDAIGKISEYEDGKTVGEIAAFKAEKDTALHRLMETANRVREANRARMDANYREKGLYGERKLTENEKRTIREGKDMEALEKLFNRMFDRVDTRPQAEFQAAFGSIGAFEHDEFVKTFNEAIAECKELGGGSALDWRGESLGLTGMQQAEKLDFLLQRFENERAARETIHNAYYGVLAGLNTEKIAQFTDGFLSGWADLTFGKKGVTAAMHFYEQALLITRESAGGYLKPAEVVGEMKSNSKGRVNELAKQLLETANENGTLFVDESGKPILDKEGNIQKLEPWQIDRALAFARGLSIVTGGTIEIAASSILSPDSAAFSDQYGQRIIAELAPFRHAFKFYAGSEFSKVLSFLMKRERRKPWSIKEIEGYAKLAFKKKIDVLNSLVPEGKERFYSVLNPLEIGGIFSRTSWRIADVDGATMINDLVKSAEGNDPNNAWIGTGIQIERKRGALVNKKNPDHLKAIEATRKQLIKIGERTPLRLFLKIKNVQNKVADEYLRERGVDVDALVRKGDDGSLKNLTKLRIEQVKNLESSAIELVLLQEKANQAKKPLDVFLNDVSDSAITNSTREFIKRIRGVWDGGERDNFLKALEDKEWSIPYTFGTDDVPYDKYSFESSGLRSLARRWGDMKSAADASKALNEFVSEGIEKFTDQKQIVDAMHAIYKGIKGYNEEDAKKFTTRLAEGVMKFYGKDYRARLPLGIGTLVGVITGKSSYAQVAFGRGAMAWDELQLNEFTRLLRNNGMLTIEQQHELQNRAGGGKKEVVWGYARTVVPLLSLALAYYMLSQVMKEEK